jgi:hypothetical protein
VRGGQGAEKANQACAEIRHGVDGKETGEEGHGVEGQGLKTPDEILKPGRSR